MREAERRAAIAGAFAAGCRRTSLESRRQFDGGPGDQGPADMGLDLIGSGNA